MAATATAKRASKKAAKISDKTVERPEQIVVTMDDGLKKAVYAKAKRDGIPMTKLGRILFESWVGAEHVKNTIMAKSRRTAAKAA